MITVHDVYEKLFKLRNDKNGTKKTVIMWNDFVDNAEHKKNYFPKHCYTNAWNGWDMFNDCKVSDFLDEVEYFNAKDIFFTWNCYNRVVTFSLLSDEHCNIDIDKLSVWLYDNPLKLRQYKNYLNLQLLDDEDIEEFKHRHENKPIVKVGNTYSMYGVEYIAKPCARCDECAFADCQCEFNVDVPACYNNVHFEVKK